MSNTVRVQSITTRKEWGQGGESVELGDAGVIGHHWLDLAIEIHLKSKRGRVENRAAICTLPKMTLNLAGYLRCKAPFKILANKSNCGLACHAHTRLQRHWDFLWVV